jgi:hypothetical protein
VECELIALWNSTFPNYSPSPNSLERTTIGRKAAKVQEFLAFSSEKGEIDAKVQVFRVARGRLAAITPKLMQKCRNSTPGSIH